MLIKTVQTKVPPLPPPRSRPSAALPLLPAEVVVGSEDEEEAQDGPEDHYVTR